MEKTLVLVDGSGYLFSSFFAIRHFKTRDGQHTGAIYGVVDRLQTLLAEFKPDYIACVFDAKGGSFRNTLYPEYKANRDEMDPDLVAQIEPTHAAVRALGVPTIVQSGVEADDVIGTLAKKAQAEGVRVIIASSDKDIAQLVGEGITLFNVSKREMLDRNGVYEKYGVYPEQVIDYLMIQGDTADNVPGVHKWGPKKAAQALETYGTLENIIAHQDELSGKTGEYFRQAVPHFELTRKLITIKTDCEVKEGDQIIDDIRQLAPRDPDVSTLRALYTRYELNAFLKALNQKVGQVPVPDSGLLGAAGGATQAAASVEALPDQGAVQADLLGLNGDLFDAPAFSPLVPAPTTLEYCCVRTWSQFDAMMQAIKAAEIVALDTETDSLDVMKAKLVGVSVSTAVGKAWYIPLAHRVSPTEDQDSQPAASLSEDDLFALLQTPQEETVPDQLPLAEVLYRLKPWLEDADAPKVLHHAKYDAHVFANQGLELRGIAHDTQLLAYVLHADEKVNLEALSRRYLGREGLSYEAVCGKGKNAISFAEVPIEQAAQYACEDADFTFHLLQVLLKELENMQPESTAQKQPGVRFIYALEMAMSQVLLQVERSGVRIDTALLAQQSQELGQEIQAIQQRVYELAGETFNLNSSTQLGHILFEKLQLQPPKKQIKRTSRGLPSTSEEVLSDLARHHPIAVELLAYRSLNKLKSTYTDPLPSTVDENNCVHTTYAQSVVISGRLASSNPNLQNIPVRTAEGRAIRQAFIARPGNLIMSADYSQIELRIMAQLSGDQNLRRAFIDGLDVHSATASEIFQVPLDAVTRDQRRTAKVINFGLIYGMGAFGLQRSLDITRKEASDYIDRYFQRYPGVRDYMQRIKDVARAQGYVETIWGRRLWMPSSIQAGGAAQAKAERLAINAPMQGSAADLIKMAMVAVSRYLNQEGLKAQIVMQVHDELVLDVPEAEIELLRSMLPQLMCDLAALSQPLIVPFDIPMEVEVGVGPNWAEAH